MNLDLFAGLELRDAGMEMAVASRTTLVARVREHLERVARSRPNRQVSIDDCADLLEAEGRTLGNAAGSVFKHDSWEFTGTWLPSCRKSNHARPVRVWRLK